MGDGPRTTSRQLLVYGFGPDSDFSGQLVGALERLEGGGALRIVDALFVQSDAQTGEISAVALGGRRLDAMVASLLEFRLDLGKRRQTTERALGADNVRALAEALEPGHALAAVLVEHVWADALEDAVSRVGGELLADRAVDASQLGRMTRDLLATASMLRSA